MSHFNYKICERFAPIFLRRTHVKLRIYYIELTLKLGINHFCKRLGSSKNGTNF
ncbi:hypothetical protein [Leptospira noguchii]|uniref:hypothetical protein n=1 Tax=Leptospira noguchii TaxID=28182 RepID=UPI001FB65D49|nr:hypothetical protein [Leptospira noguchii]UOG53582.1 hypothetical protein MAL09_05350 [Leptospira noguchii]